MPEIPQTSQQMESLTTSQDGTGRVAKLNPESHFFIEGNVFAQTPAQAFGPVNDTQFRTTATVTFSGTKNIFALCMGTVFLQPQQDNSKVNLILRPYKQPIKGLNIKYIIYRGLTKANFVTGAGKLAGSETSGSGFVKFLWAQFNKFYNIDDGGTLPASGFDIGFLGFPHTPEQQALQHGDDLIDQYYYKLGTFSDDPEPMEDPAAAYELPIIPRGLHLGTATSQLGMDIVLNDGDYIIENDTNPIKLDLAYARSGFYVLDTALDPDAFMKKRIKERATKFLDVAAYYGLHANGAGILHAHNDLNTVVTLTSKGDIADKLAGFTTSNRFYLYIQSNRQRSYSFYNNHLHPDNAPNNMKIGATLESLTETTFTTNGWPVHIIDQTQDPSNQVNTISIQLVTDNHEDAALFVQIGELGSPHEENFVRQTNLVQQPPEDDSVTIDNNYTQAVTLTTPARDGNTIASFAQLIYEGKHLLVTDANDPDQQYVLKDIDDLFGLIDATSAFVFNQGQLPTVVNETLQIINFLNTVGGNDIGAVKHQRIEDKIQTDEDNFLPRVTYETLMNNVANRATLFQKKAIKDFDNKKSGFYNYGIEQQAFYLPKPPHYIKKRFLTIDNEIVIGLELETQASLLPNKKILGITEDEFAQLKELIPQNNLVNVKLFFKDNNYTSDEYYIAPEGYEYKLYNLFIVAEDISGLLKFYKPQDEIKIYHIKGLVYTSNSYASAVPDRFSSYDDDYILPLIETDLTENL